MRIVPLLAPRGPSLSLNFLSGTLDGRVSFSRSSNAWYFNSSGLLTQASSNAPRFDYNPSTLALNGLLIEGQSTNLQIYSENAFSGANWTTINATAVDSAVTSPDGTTNASSLTDNSTSGVHYTNPSGQQSFTNGSTYTWSVFAKAGTATVIQLATTAVVSSAYVNFNLSNGTVSSSGGSITSSGIQAVGNGWYRCWFTVSNGGTTGLQSNYFLILLTNNNGSATREPSYVGSGETAYIYGAQIEQASFASSYIPTTSATVTRAADAVTVPLTGINTAQGTLFYKFIPEEVGTGGLLDMYQDSSNKWSDRLNNTNLYQVAGSTVYGASAASLVANDLTRDAFSWAPNNFDFARNGTLSTHGSSGGTFSGPATLYLGAYDTSSYGNLWLQSVKYWTRKLPGSQIAGLN